MKRTVLAICLITLGILAAVLWWRGGAAPRSVVVAQASRPQASPGDNASNATHGSLPRLPTGTALAAQYRFDLAAPPPLGRVEVAVQGTLELAEPLTWQGATWVPARLLNPTVRLSDSARKILDLQSDDASLARPWMLRATEDGRVAEVRFEPGTALAGQSVLAALAYSLQLAQPADGQARSWQADESDANGAFHALYTREPTGAVTKQWSSGEARPGQRTTTTATFTLDPAGLQRLTVDERGTASTGNLDTHSFVSMALAIDLTRKGKADSRWAAALRPDLLRPYTAATAAVHWKQDPAPTRAFATVMADVQASAAKTDAGGRVNLRNELTRAIAADPATVASVETQLRAGGLEEPVERLVIAALVGARTPAAQTAVGALVKDPALDESLRVRVLQSASLMSSPSPAFVATLGDLVARSADPGYRGAVAPTLGASIAFLGEQHPQEAEIALNRLVDQARIVLDRGHGHHPVATPVSVAVAWLAGLGNTGHPDALPLILGALSDPDELVRGAAALALRRQDPAACLEAMVTRMAKDPSVHVRENVVDAARDMGPAVTEALVKKALYYDDSAFVRSAAAYAISVWSGDSPGMRAVLVDALKHEKHPDVAERLQNYIQQGRVAGAPAISDSKVGGHP